MKRMQTIALVMVLAMLLGACGGSSSQTAGGSQGGGGTSSGGSGEKIILKLGDTQSEDHPQSRSYRLFADRVAELTGGQVEVEIFINSALGNHRDMNEGIKLGTLQVTKCMATDLSAYIPEIQVFGMPYMFDSREHMLRAVDGEVGAYFNDVVMAQEDLICLAWFDAGTRCVYNSKRPVEKVEDMNGLLLRVPENPIYMSTMAAFGATGTPMAMGDVYTSLQTGVIDGAENAPAVYESLKHFEAAPYFSHTDHIITPDVFIMKRSYLESLPQDIQDAIIAAGKELQAHERELWLESENDYVDKLLAAGVEMNDVDKTGFQEAAKEVWADYVDIIGQDIIDMIQAA